MTVIAIELLTRRFHATPWDRHVNEGEVEWPPSPWRLLCALVATWHRKASEEIERDTLLSLCEQLGSESPRYRASSAVSSHTRHYMPSYHEGKTDLVFDGFLDVGGNQIGANNVHLVVDWPTVKLDDPERHALSLLLERMSYLGRAESWIAAHLVADEADGPRSFNCTPIALDQRAASGSARENTERIRLLAPVPQNDYLTWRAAELQRRLNILLNTKKDKARAKEKDPERIKITPKERRRIEEELPADILGVLEQETGDLRRAGWSRPPGSIWAGYAREKQLLDPPRALPASRKPVTTKPTVARFAVAAQVLPRITHCLSFSEAIRRTLIGKSCDDPVLTGHEADGSPKRDHGHLFVLPETNSRARDQITHVTLFARDGFSPRNLDLLAELPQRFLSRSRAIDGRETQLVLLGIGRPEQFVGADGKADVRAGHCPLFASSRRWVSRTPFIATRHPKTTRAGAPKIDPATHLPIGSPAHDLARLLGTFLGQAPAALEASPRLQLRGRDLQWIQFLTQRRSGHGRRASGSPSGFELTFDTPICGPVAAGYGAHFGLGQFVPEENADR